MYFKKFYSPGEFEGATMDSIKIVSRGPQDNVSEQPAPTTERVETPAPPVTPIAEMAAPVEVVVPITPAAPIQATTEVPVVKPEPAFQPAVPEKEKSWKEVLKEKGFDDEFINLAEYRQKTGTIKPYLEAISVDYKGMSPEDVMRHDIKKRYPALSAQFQDRIFKEEVMEKYKLDPDLYPDDFEYGKARLQYEADAKRQQFIEEQNQFTVPDRDLTVEQQSQQAEQDRIMQQETQMIRDTIVNNPIAQTLMKDKKFVIDYGGTEGFNFEVENPQSNLDVLLDPIKGRDAVTKDGKPDADKLMYASLAFTGQLPRIFKALVEHGKSLGLQTFVQRDLENVRPGETVTTGTGATSWADAWKTQAKVVKT